jgi:4-hydroxy-2-oxoheptanedioate aldolase
MEKSKKEMHGIWRILPSMALTEIIQQAGFDFQILDCEHGAYDFQTLEQDIRICKRQNSLVYVRVGGLNKVEVQRCLDFGADGIVFPQLNSLADFELATKLVNFPPHGVRGFNPFVAAGEYGFGNVTNKKVECIVILETLSAFKELDKILGLKNIDKVYVGVYDLSAQLNCIGDMAAPQLIEVVDEIIKKCKAYAKSSFFIVKNIDEYLKYHERGVDHFVHTVESHQIKKSFINLKNEYQIKNE